MPVKFLYNSLSTGHSPMFKNRSSSIVPMLPPHKQRKSIENVSQTDEQQSSTYMVNTPKQ